MQVYELNHFKQGSIKISDAIYHRCFKHFNKYGIKTNYCSLSSLDNVTISDVDLKQLKH